ncbi:hypothetical protein LZ32DRAFT_188106 [Colletotrichum eremochloae]|nr:hypothetical protein LZ32DRAFT_188106 [Colletotrichum eremochloae]
MTLSSAVLPRTRITKMPMQTHGAPVSLSMSQQTSNPRFPGRDPLNKPVLIKITQSAFWQMSKTAITMLFPETRFSSRRLIRRQNAGRNRHFRGQTELPAWQEGTLQLRMEGISSRGRSLLPVRYISFHRPKSIHTLELPSASTEKATFKVQGVDDPDSHQEQSASSLSEVIAGSLEVQPTFHLMEPRVAHRKTAHRRRTCTARRPYLSRMGVACGPRIHY